MSTIQEVRKGDVGTTFEVTLKEDSTVVDISSASLRQIKFGKPGDITVTQTGELVGDGSDGKIKFVTTSVDDLDITGEWSIQAYVEIGGAKHHSDIKKFKVYSNL